MQVAAADFPIPIPCVGTFLALAFLGLLFFLFRVSQSASRASAATADRIFALKPTAVSRQECWWLGAAEGEQDVIDALVECLKRGGGEVVRREKDKAVVYLGSRAEAKMHGIWQLGPWQLPTRVLIGCYVLLPQRELCVQTRLDEDFGFKLFFGSVRKRFQAAYDEAFQQILSALFAAAKPWEPTPVNSWFP